MVNNVKKGIFIIILATLFFAIMDGVSRYLAEKYDKKLGFGLARNFNKFKKERRNKKSLLFQTTIHTIDKRPIANIGNINRSIFFY